jgi:hypothetical protein
LSGGPAIAQPKRLQKQSPNKPINLAQRLSVGVAPNRPQFRLRRGGPQFQTQRVYTNSKFANNPQRQHQGVIKKPMMGRGRGGGMQNRGGGFVGQNRGGGFGAKNRGGGMQMRGGMQMKRGGGQQQINSQPVKKSLDMDLDEYMSKSKSHLDADLDGYMSKSKTHLDADLDTYMAQAPQ